MEAGRRSQCTMGLVEGHKSLYNVSIRRLQECVLYEVAEEVEAGKISQQSQYRTSLLRGYKNVFFIVECVLY